MKPFALVMAICIAFLWGLSTVIHKHVLYSISHQTALVLSSVFYMICTLVYAWYNWERIAQDKNKLNVQSISFLAFTAIVCGFVTNVLYFMVLKRYESHIVSALIYSSPVFTLVLAYFILHERVTFHGFLGVAFITVGVIFLAFNKAGYEPFFEMAAH